MNPFVNLIITILSLYSWVLISQILLFWLIYFRIVNPAQPLVSKVFSVLNQLTEPVLRRIRAVLPPVNGIDLSPIALFLALYFLQDFLVYYFA